MALKDYGRMWTPGFAGLWVGSGQLVLTTDTRKRTSPTKIMNHQGDSRKHIEKRQEKRGMGQKYVLWIHLKMIMLLKIFVTGVKGTGFSHSVIENTQLYSIKLLIRESTSLNKHYSWQNVLFLITEHEVIALAHTITISIEHNTNSMEEYSWA